MAVLPQEEVDKAFAVLEFCDAAERERELEAIRCSLRGDDDGAGVGARLRFRPKASTKGDAVTIDDEEPEAYDLYRRS